MSSRFTRVRMRGWWWVFSVLIAGPAVVLASLGLRAIRADRVEHEQQLREQQTQTAHLANAAVANAIERTTALLDRMDSEWLTQPDLRLKRTSISLFFSWTERACSPFRRAASILVRSGSGRSSWSAPDRFLLPQRN